jgi:hypothetical protein
LNLSGCGNTWVLSCRNMPKVSGACNRPWQSCIDHALALSEKSINYQLRSIYDTIPRGTMRCATQTILTGVRDGRSSWKIRVPCCLFRTPKTVENYLLWPRRSAVIPDCGCEPNTSSIQPPSLSGLLGAFITGLQVPGPEPGEERKRR